MITNELNPEFEIDIEEMYLRVHKVLINPAVIMGHNQMLSTTNAKYPYTKTEVKIMTIAAGNQTYTWDNVFQGLRPNKIVIGFHPVKRQQEVTQQIHSNSSTFISVQLMSL